MVSHPFPQPLDSCLMSLVADQERIMLWDLSLVGIAGLNSLQCFDTVGRLAERPSSQWLSFIKSCRHNCDSYRGIYLRRQLNVTVIRDPIPNLFLNIVICYVAVTYKALDSRHSAIGTK